MDKIAVVADMIRESKRVVVFTGAGVSTESGIPDFRSPGGVWERYDPNELTYQKFLSSDTSREKYWAYHKEVWYPMKQAEPNPGHYAIAELDRMGKLDCVITQNVDYLHQRAGIPDDKVIELHGTIHWVNCLGCQKRYLREEIQRRLEEGVKIPTCDDCGGYLKPATVAFGQPMPQWETSEAEHRSAACDLFIVGGSSLVVYPAAQMPVIAKHSGAKLVIINLAPTPHDHYADVVINEKTGVVLSQVVALLKAKE